MMHDDSHSETSYGDEDHTVASSVDETTMTTISWTEEMTSWDEPDYRPRTPFSPPLPEYKGLTFTMLPKPSFMETNLDDDGWGMFPERTKHVKPRLVLEEEKPVVVVKSSPWKKMEETKENATTTTDPWAFLEEKKKPVPQRPVKKPSMSSSPPPKPASAPVHRDTQKLCKYKTDCRMNRDGKCTMVHSLNEWTPRVCKFDNRCRHRSKCGYYHTDTNLQTFLKTMLQRPESIYYKNGSFYQKYV